jgi:hypothetical protein
MDVGIPVQQLRNSREGSFDLVITGACGGQRYDANGGGEFVVDPMIQFVQRDSFLRQ